MNNSTFTMQNSRVVPSRWWGVVLAGLLLCSAGVATAQEHPAEKYGWGFVNFGTPRFGWDIYRNSFYGIPVDSSTSWFTAPFDKLFYDLAFETTLADPSGSGGGGAGNCFGLSILSLMINNYGGYKGFCAPTIQYTDVDGSGAPTMPGLLRAINIMHGHQISLLFIQSVIEQANGGHSLDAAYGVTRATQDIAREGPVIISVTKSLLPTGGGHAIIGYAVENNGGGKYKIKVVDPNRIWRDTSVGHRGWYTMDSNSVHVNGHKWSFLMAGKSSAWPTEGDDTSPGAAPGSGNLTVFPISVAGPTSRTPSSLGLGVTQLLTKVFIMNKDGALRGRISQVHNADGKRLFSDPEKYMVDWDSTTGICGMVPYYPLAAPPNGVLWPFELYFHKGALNAASVDFNTGEGKAEIVAGDNRGYIRVWCDDPDVSARLRYTGLGGAEPKVIVENASKATTIDIELLVPVQPGTTNRVWKLERVEIPAQVSGAISLSVNAFGGAAVEGKSSSPVQLAYAQGSLAVGKSFFAEPVKITPSIGAVIERDHWVEHQGMPGN